VFIVNDSNEKKNEKDLSHDYCRWKFTGIASLHKKKNPFKQTRYAEADSDGRAVRGSSLAGIASSNPAEGMDICLL